MNVKVLYHSSTGNTKKLADAIASALNITDKPISSDPSAFSAPVDLLFIGDGIYFGKPSKCTIAVINQLSPQTVKNVAVFATYGGQSKIGTDLQEMIKDKGINVICEPFICASQSWVFTNRRHPNDGDLKKTVRYAKEVNSTVSL